MGPRRRLLRARAGARGDEPEATPDVVLHMELGRLYQLLEKFAKSADHFARVVYALDHEKEFKLDAKTKQALLNPPAPTYLLFAESFLRAGRTKRRWRPSKKPTNWRRQGTAGLSSRGVDLRDGKVARRRNLQTYFDLREPAPGLPPIACPGDPQASRQDGRATGAIGEDSRRRPGQRGAVVVVADQYREKARFDKAEPLYRLLVKQTPLICRLSRLAGDLPQDESARRPADRLVRRPAAARCSIRWTARSAPSATTNRCWTRSWRRPRSLQAHPERMDYGARLAVALLASEAKRFDVAGDFFQRAAQLRPKEGAEVLLAWARTLLGQDRAEDAAKVLKQAIAMKPPGENPAACYYYLAGAEAARATPTKRWPRPQSGRSEKRFAAVRRADGLGVVRLEAIRRGPQGLPGAAGSVRP